MRAFIRHVLHWLIQRLFRVRVTGWDQPIDTSRVLIVANHASFLDGLLLGLFLPVEPLFIVHTSIARSGWFRLLLSQVNYLTVDTTSPLTMKKVIRLLESGQPVMIFPEGRITITGSMMKIYDGPAFVAARTGATLLRVHLASTEYSLFSRLTGKAPRRLLPQVTLTILPPTHIPMPEAPMARQRRRLAGEHLRRLMQEMSFAARPSQTLYGALCDAIALHGRGYRLIEDLKQIEYSYQDLLKMTLMLTRLVERATPEVTEGQRIGLLLPNLTPTVALIFGLTARQRIPAMLNYTSGSDALQAACDAATLSVIVTSHAFVEQAKLAERLATLRNVRLLYLEELREQINWRDKLWLLGNALWRPRAFERPATPETAAVVLFTSGSEGKPKGVVLPHRALLANLAQIRAVIDLSQNDRFLNALPIFHAFGLTAGTLLPILSGSGLFLYPSPLHYRLIPEVAYDRNCTVLFGTSTFLGQYGRFANPYDFFKLRHVIAGAEKLTDPVRMLWSEKFGLRILEGYGTTETAPVLATNTPLACRFGSVGELLPGIEYRLLPVSGIERGGMLHVRGPNVMAGYLKVDAPGVLQPPESECGPGWYETGDVVEVDADGFVHIVGRVKRFAKVAGEMVSLETVERVAQAAAPGFAHGATSQPDVARGEALVLFTTDATLTRERLQQQARELGVAELAVPRKIVPLASLPLLGTGKTDYVTLKRLAEEV
ncbi:MAG: bifunctional acyl-ACP--phospholipid O-acyltransferase/long-chain-fatty-acid--ACP ligase [Magnetococcales bacterium]|nr:bifunctional acyl-ACP--phospholipid O-acyltransferase/long-chain-fatty-acid--ACP ligase [Magnetococcales bacterium]NGZ04870.1 bifunctional acyl-ACP--phospholipid O-acyltransferase/long-chain-fatty-acid--ACP ligase [Magnetococcales bacterium]